MEVKRTTGPRIYDRCLAIACGYLGGAEAITKRSGGHRAFRAGLAGSCVHDEEAAYQLGREVCELLGVDRFAGTDMDRRYESLREVDAALGIEPVEATLQALYEDVCAATGLDLRRRPGLRKSHAARASTVFFHLARSDTFASLNEASRTMGLSHSTAAGYLRMVPDNRLVEAVQHRRAAKADGGC